MRAILSLLILFSIQGAFGNPVPPSQLNSNFFYLTPLGLGATNPSELETCIQFDQLVTLNFSLAQVPVGIPQIVSLKLNYKVLGQLRPIPISIDFLNLSEVRRISENQFSMTADLPALPAGHLERLASAFSIILTSDQGSAGTELKPCVDETPPVVNIGNTGDGSTSTPNSPQRSLVDSSVAGQPGSSATESPSRMSMGGCSLSSEGRDSSLFFGMIFILSLIGLGLTARRQNAGH